MTSFVAAPSFDIQSLKGSHLLLPSVSIGNVPQLTCDLIIHTLQLSRVGFIDSDAVIPVTGQYEDQLIGISVPIEVYQSKDRQWTVIQQRSPTLKGKKQSLISGLTAFIESAQFAKVVLLTSLDAARRLDSQISSIPFRVVGDSTTVQDIKQTINVPELETEQQEQYDADTDMTGSSSSLPSMHGAGIARSLYQNLLDAKVNVIMFCMFVLEGDNVQDSVELANVLNTYYQIKSNGAGTSSSWTPPKSWEYLFGTPFNAEIYQ